MAEARGPNRKGETGKRRNKRWPYAVAITVTVAVIGLLAAGPLLGVHTVSARKPPLPLPPRGFSHALFDRLLSRIVRGDEVDYRALRRRAADLERYAATLAQFGPNRTPERFSSRSQRLAYYLNAYNALVLLGVLRSWPITSVREVRGPIEPRPGFGFFWAQHFELDGERINLYDLENDDLLASFGDARIHAAINCASASCPALSSRAFEASTLSRQLDAAAQALASHRRHVRVDDQRREVVLSAIYDWFRADFESHAKAIGAGSTVLDWIGHYADAKGKPSIIRAKSRRYRVRFSGYDWRLNAIRKADAANSRASAPILVRKITPDAPSVH